MICSGLNAFLTIYCPLFLIRQSNMKTGLVFGGQVTYVSEEVELAAGDLFTVTLGSNHTTGFQWPESAQIDDQSVLEQLAHRFVPPEEDTPEAAGEEVWTFKALKAGSTEVSMEYSQPGEGGEKAEWTFKLVVVVK
jgi:predicted secreted protein